MDPRSEKGVADLVPLVGSEVLRFLGFLLVEPVEDVIYGCRGEVGTNASEETMGTLTSVRKGNPEKAVMVSEN